MDSPSLQILAEIESVEIALENLEQTKKRPQITVIELAAMGTFLHNIYSGFENILKQILKFKNISIVKSANWHKELLQTSIDEQIISARLGDRLFEYLGFRHFFVHSYGFKINQSQIEILASDIGSVYDEFVKQIKVYINLE